MVERIGVLTSGGDAPGMNACVRSIVRVAAARGLAVVGIQRGYQGLIFGELEDLGPRSVSNIIQRGGTVLKTSRCKEFKTLQGLKKAREVLEHNSLDALITIGGDGTFRGAVDLAKTWSGKIVGVPGTIDNDLFGTDDTIGYDTAVNTALDAIDKIRDTAEAHERFFLVEVMGRGSGFIALEVGIAGGAEEVLIPETHTSLAAVCRRLCAGKKKGKRSSILVVAEGEEEGGAFRVAEKLRRLGANEYRVVVLGHLQRGGSPTARDRVLATKLGAFAVDAVRRGKTGVMVGEVHGKLRLTPLPETWKRKKPLDSFLLKLLPVLAQ